MYAPINNINGIYDFSSPSLLEPDGMRLVQIQPTLKCNLRCAHCYSESGPEHNREIPFKKIVSFFNEVSSLGYHYVGVSGGEPFLWSDLEKFLSFSKDNGFSTSVSTNGTLLSKTNVTELIGRADIIAVSVDGPPEDHNALRRSSSAFSSMQRGLSILRDAGIPFSLSYTLTRYNCNRLEWLYEFASKEGAFGLNIHPLSGCGAAATNISDAIPDSQEFKVAAWLLALLVHSNDSGGPAITLDVVKPVLLEHCCWPLLQDQLDFNHFTFTDLVPALVLEPDGCISPFTYGFPRHLAIGNINQSNLKSLTDIWCTSSAPIVAKILNRTLKRLAQSKADYCDLFGEMLISAHSYVCRENSA
jgi:MoaA/NifB/PqqE/SkfB family radical SAM enzyme